MCLLSYAETLKNTVCDILPYRASGELAKGRHCLLSIGENGVWRDAELHGCNAGFDGSQGPADSIRMPGIG